MKNLPVVRPSSCPAGIRPTSGGFALLAWLCSVACAPTNGTLFEQVSAPEDPAPAISAPAESEPDAVVPEPSVLTAPMDSEQTGTNAHLPVSAEPPPTVTTPPPPPPPPA